MQRFLRFFYDKLIYYIIILTSAACQFEAAGIHKPDRFSVNDCLRFNRVAGYAGCRIGNSTAFMQKPVKQCRLSDIRTADDGHKRCVFVFFTVVECCFRCSHVLIYIAVHGRIRIDNFISLMSISIYPVIFAHYLSL